MENQWQYQANGITPGYESDSASRARYMQQNTAQQMQITSVNSQADSALENSARTRGFAEILLAELRQDNLCETGAQPCRSGIDGKLADAAENSSITLSVLQDIRKYLLG